MPTPNGSRRDARRRIARIALASAVVPACTAPAAESPQSDGLEPTVVMALDIAPVWSGHPVGFCLLTTGGRQYAAFYDAERHMTVVARDLDSPEWESVVLPSTLGWDSHNYVTMAADDDGFLHLSGNMHCRPLVYFRTETPHDISTFRAVPHMAGRDEDRCTYPRFMRDGRGRLIFHYRDGSSGNGSEIYNVYDHGTQTWRRLLDTPLTDGQGRMNAYAAGPLRGPDGNFHLCWMWRDHGGCESNHDISYARSVDLVSWETAAGEAIELPITLDTPGVIVDPVPVKQGLINMGFSVGFDARNRPVVSYHKYDEAGNSQVYSARWEDSRWVVRQTSAWTSRWEFSGGGSVPCEVRAGTVRVGPDGELLQSYIHFESGSGTWKLDPETLKPVGTVVLPPAYPRDLRRPESEFPAIQVRWANDAGACPEPGRRFVLRWETLGSNRDRPRSGPLPAPSMLRVYLLRTGA